MVARRRIDAYERQRLADRLRAIMAASALTESAIANEIGLGQPFVSRFLSCDYKFETPKVAQLAVYVTMRDTANLSRQLELPFETTIALNRFLRANGDVDLLNSLINVLAARSGR